MSPLFTFILGLLIGWLIEWVIDYLYWRRRYPEKEAAGKIRPIENMGSRSAVKATPDDLKIIKGIGPVIERKLNDAGIYTYDQLGSLSTAGLRRILGNSIERLADEESLLKQARDLARRK